MRHFVVSAVVACALSGAVATGQTMPATTSVASATTLPTKDAHGNPLRRAKTGHVSNYDEHKVGTYTLPNPLVLQDGTPVRDAGMWYARRRLEILDLYSREIYGGVPSNAPSVTFSVVATTDRVLDGRATVRMLEGRVEGGGEPVIKLMLFTPVNAAGRVPVIFNLSFSTPDVLDHSAKPATTQPRRMLFDTAPVTDIVSRGYAYAVVHYTDIQPDVPNTFAGGVIHRTLAAGETRPPADEWGTISAWTWGVSRVVDYLQTDPAVDGKRIAIVGHSRLGKTVLWAGAQDQRIALVFSSCGGELGSALARRDFGETVDDMAQNYGYQFAGNLQKYAGHWNEMPVDAHMLLSLIAPRPLLVTGGSEDLWADPHGEFLSCVAASPVYELLGGKGIGTDQAPQLDTPAETGDIAFEEHTGPHTITPGDWKIFLDFAGRYLHPVQPTTAP